MAGERTSWRSGGGTERNAVRHRWQDDDRTRERVGGPRRTVLRGLLLGTMLVGLLGAFAWYLDFRPVRTPVVAVFAPAYPSPFPPFAHAREDRDELARLHGKSIDLIDVSPAWDSRDVGLRVLERELAATRSRARRAGSLVLYLAVHGAVDDEGRACLIPPGASPTNARTWLPVRELLKTVDESGVNEDAPVLVVLDASRIETDWNLGQLQAGFVDRLAAEVDTAGVANVNVMTSAGAFETAAGPVELGGTPFARTFTRGLAGAADDPGDGEGNGDGRVSLRELHDFVATRVDRWSRHHRGRPQRPRLLPAETPKAPLVWSLRPDRRDLDPVVVEPDPSFVTDAELLDLWRAYERIDATAAARVDPVAFGEIRRALLRIERTNDAGHEYCGRARTEFATLLTRLRAAATNPASIRAEWSWLSTSVTEPLPRTLPSHTLPLAERLGTLSAEDGGDVRKAIADYTGGNATWSKTESRIGARVDAEQRDLLAEVRFPRLLTASGIADGWRLGEVWTARAETEKLAAPIDERVLAWTREAMRTADEARRLAEDHVLSEGTADADAWTRVRTANEAVGRRIDATAKAYGVLDRATVDLPLLAAWATAPGRLRGLDEQALERLRASLVETSTNVRRLAELLDRTGDSTEPSMTLPFVEVQDGLAASLDDLRGRFDAEYARVESSLADLVGLEVLTEQDERAMARAVSDAGSLLSVPMLPSDSGTAESRAARRIALRTTTQRVRGTLAKRFAAETGDDGEDTGTDPDLGIEADRILAAWRVHPSLAVLGLDELDGTDDREWSRSGADLRTHLRTIDTQLAAIRTGAVTSLDETGRRLRRADRLVRRVSPLAYARTEDDPVRRRRSFDVQRLLAWNSERVLDDFWGPTDPGGESYFALAARTYVEHLGDFALDAPLVRDDVERIRTRLEARTAAARDGVTVGAENVVVLDPSAGADVLVSVDDGPTAAAAALPEGVARLQVRNEAGVVERTRMPFNIPAPPTDADPDWHRELRKSLETTDLAGGRPNLTAEVLFRGHRYTTDFLFEPVDGPSTTFEPRTFDTARVNVTSDRTRPLSIVFVLDCSNSMFEDSAEGPREVGGTVPRKLDVARIALANMLDRLAATPDTHVGVVLFGHRVGWEPGKLDLLRVQQRYARIADRPPELKPYADVETVLPLGRFDPSLSAATGQLLGTTLPWGESPLYLAVVRAAEQLQTGRDSQRVVVVLTDGVNDQFDPPPEFETELRDAITAVEGADARVHVVGFGIPAEEREKAKDEFGRLGSFDVAPARATSLVDSIRRRLAPLNYTAGRERERVGSPATLAIDERPTTATVTLGDATERIELWGGETIGLRLANDQLVVPADERGQLVRPLVPGDADEPARQLEMRATAGDEGTVRFEFGIRRRDGRFTRRPKSVWFEVIPLDVDGRQLSGLYRFTDPAYVEGRAIPVLGYAADRWPAEATAAEVRAWVRYDATPADHAVDVAPGAGVKPIAVPFPTLPGVVCEVATNHLDEGRIDVYERDSDGGHLGQLHVEVVTKRRLIRVVRQFDARHEVVTHTFLFDVTAAGTDVPRIEFRTGSTLMTGASKLARPARLPVTKTPDLIRVAPLRSGDPLR